MFVARFNVVAQCVFTYVCINHLQVSLVRTSARHMLIIVYCDTYTEGIAWITTQGESWSRCAAEARHGKSKKQLEQQNEVTWIHQELRNEKGQCVSPILGRLGVAKGAPRDPQDEHLTLETQKKPQDIPKRLP